MGPSSRRGLLITNRKTEEETPEAEKFSGFLYFIGQ